MEPKYKKIKHSIKSNILEGIITPHEKISSESQLMQQFSVSRHTVRLALGELVNEGWLYREQGAGTFCADRSSQQTTSLPSSNRNIAIVTTFISEYIFPSIIRGAERYLSRKGYNVSIFNTNNEYEQEKQILNQILTGNYAGVIIEPTHSASSSPNLKFYLNLEKEKIPYVMINAKYDELEPVSFTMDDVLGGYLQTKHVMDLGHTNIACIYKTDDAQGQNRLKGFIKAHRESITTLNPKNIITYESENEFIKPLQGLKELLDLKIDRPTAVVCYNDQLVLRLFDYFRNASIRVPEDISIVGYDDSMYSEITEIKLTSVIHPKSELGYDAAVAIIEMIEKPGARQINQLSKLYTPELKIRQSTQLLENDMAI